MDNRRVRHLRRSGDLPVLLRASPHGSDVDDPRHRPGRVSRRSSEGSRVTDSHSGGRKRIVTVVLEVNPDAEDDQAIAEAIRWSLEGSDFAAISPQLGERIVSIEERDA